MQRHLRDELLGIGADFVFRKYIKIDGDTLKIRHELHATFDEDEKIVELEEVLRLLKGGVVVEARSRVLDDALAFIALKYNPRVRFTTLDGSRPFIQFDDMDNELVIKAMDHDFANRYLGEILVKEEKEVETGIE